MADGVAGALPATVRVDRIIALAAAVFRLGACVSLVVAAGSTPGLWLVCVLVFAQSIGFVVWWWRSGRIGLVSAAVDAVVLTVLVTLGPMFNYVQIGVITAGLAPWRIGAALTAAAVAAAKLATTDVPLWISLPDTANLVAVLTVAWLIAAWTRGAAREIDRRRADALAASTEAARTRERVRQAELVGDRLFDTLDRLTAAGAVADPSVLARLDAETLWLREFLDDRRPVSTDVRAALLAVVLARRDDGLVVEVDVPPALPALPAPTVTALAGAVWEALTNAAKHSGARSATVRATVESDVDGQWVVVEVVDHGHGCTPARAAGGIGVERSIVRRITEVGGRAGLDSAPGRGTVVRLTVPR
ncbi:sensor histidine kinase [Actinophytocola sediminis]